MVRKLVLTLFLAAVAWSAAAQRPRTRLEWGVIGGLGVVAVEPQILYVRQGLRIRPAGIAEVNVKSKSIDVPVLVSLRLLNPFRIYAGPVFTVMNDCKRKAGDDLIDFGRVRPTLSYTVGAGVVVLRHLLIDLRYNGQFRGKHDVALPEDVMLPEIRSYNVALSVGYLF